MADAESTEAVLYEVKDGIGVITLNRPTRLNAWNTAMHVGYYGSLSAAAADPEVRVIVVTGAGRGFCAGADMDSLQAIGDRQDSPSDPEQATKGQEPAEDYNATYPMTLPKPVIAAVNGACAGLGLVHALAADIRFAAAGAKFTVAFSRRGLIAEHGLSWTLPRLVGQSVAADLIFSGRVFLAEEANELGVVNKVFPAEELMDATLAYARDLATNASPTSLAIMKRQIYTHPQMTMADAAAESNRLMLESLGRADFREGVASFIEKRPPAFAPHQPGLGMAGD